MPAEQRYTTRRPPSCSGPASPLRMPRRAWPPSEPEFLAEAAHLLPIPGVRPPGGGPSARARAARGGAGRRPDGARNPAAARMLWLTTPTGQTARASRRWPSWRDACAVARSGPARLAARGPRGSVRGRHRLGRGRRGPRVRRDARRLGRTETKRSPRRPRRTPARPSSTVSSPTPRACPSTSPRPSPRRPPGDVNGPGIEASSGTASRRRRSSPARSRAPPR